MSLFIKAIPNSRPDINRRQTMIKWPALVAMALCAAILPSGPAPATPLVDSAPEATVADGIVAIREGNFREAVAIWTPHAEAGNPAANYSLGLVYSRDRGAGMPARPELSHRHYKAAAHRGHVDSIFELAFQYERGIGTEANTDHALAYYRVAAAKNHLNAQYNLAVLLSRGGDVKPDLREAFFWAAAARNNARIRPRGELTLEKVSRLAQMIRERLPHQTASKAGLAATRLTGQPI